MDQRRQSASIGTLLPKSQRASVEPLTLVAPPAASQQQPAASLLTPPSVVAQSSTLRPLSDIREASDSPLGKFDAAKRLWPKTSKNEDDPVKAFGQSNPTRRSSTLSLQPSSLPQRRSSKNGLRQRHSQSLEASRNVPCLLPTLPQKQDGTIPSRGRSTSPVRSAMLRLDPISSEMRRIPSRTFVRSVRPVDILDLPKINHARVALDLRVTAPLFIGGGTVEGQVHMVIDGGKTNSRRNLRPDLSIGRITIDILGVETSYGKHFVFRSLANELIDEAHPPPSFMIAAPRPISDAFWAVTPCASMFPFRMNLPIEMGPPPYDSKHAAIRYVLCATVAIREGDKHHRARRSQGIVVLSVHDPEKALVNLPNPLIAEDEISLSKTGAYEVIKLTAGVHRQTWVSGIALFVDVHISNRSEKVVKKVELALEKATTFYPFAAPSTRIENADYLRLPHRSDNEIMARGTIKRGQHGWLGVLPHSQETRTCYLEIPRGIATIDTGRFFGVRFLLNVQIPVTIIHPNSLDIVPNSLAQVAAAIDQRRSLQPNVDDSTFNYHQAQAYTAPRRQSMEQFCLDEMPNEEEHESTRQRNGSPRRSHRSHAGRVSGHDVYIPNKTSERLVAEDKRQSQLRKTRSSIEARGPRLQRSTSGLAFDYLNDSSIDVLDGASRARGVRSRAESLVQWELSLARKRSKANGVQGWKNVANEEAKRHNIKDTLWS